MSADNWAICPSCAEAAKQEKLARAQAAVDAYGKVTPEEYQELVEKSIEEIPLRETFREDYEIYGAADGTIMVDYSGHCQECGVGLDFKHEHKFFPKDE